mgnify:CR=1 FL=1
MASVNLILEKDLKKMSRDSFFKKATVYKENGIFWFYVMDSLSQKYSILKFGYAESRSFKNVNSVYQKLLELDVFEYSFYDKDKRKELANG